MSTRIKTRVGFERWGDFWWGVRPLLGQHPPHIGRVCESGANTGRRRYLAWSILVSLFSEGPLCFLFVCKGELRANHNLWGFVDKRHPQRCKCGFRSGVLRCCKWSRTCALQSHSSLFRCSSNWTTSPGRFRTKARND